MQRLHNSLIGKLVVDMPKLPTLLKIQGKDWAFYFSGWVQVDIFNPINKWIELKLSRFHYSPHHLTYLPCVG